ncbi:hypothetical protein [Mesorhizobium sp. SP-1A]|uniref:hypothetical protein n=1 Tax=Mesorhizobium sp. SP-1A TaxID=3077840 RepID=UPI0028F6D8B4|nr:hypothetical protein [Mesorhizobium sp. SP-1A]
MSAPACNSGGLVLADLKSHQCRFPLDGQGAETRFCAVEIAPGEWLPGFSGGSYCRFHRLVSRGRGTEAERAAPRVLERLG